MANEGWAESWVIPPNQISLHWFNLLFIDMCSLHVLKLTRNHILVLFVTGAYQILKYKARQAIGQGAYDVTSQQEAELGLPNASIS